MKIQFINCIPLNVISGGNIYNIQIIESLRQNNFEVDYNLTPSDKNYDITIVDSLCMEEIDTKSLKLTHRIIALIHLIPELPSNIIDFYRTNSSFIVTGNPIKQELMAKWKLSNDNIFVIRPGIPNHWKAKNNHSIKITNIVINANFIERKRYEWLIPILKNINKSNIIIHIIGNNTIEPNYAKSICKSLKNKSLKNRIHFYFNISQDEIYKKLVTADLFLSLSKYESFGMSIFEAISVGTPCLAFLTGDIDLFNQYPNYIGIENHNMEKFSTVLKDLHEGKIADYNFNISQLPINRTWDKVNYEFQTLLKG
ncbi:glycosyltransferase [uncultured Winogradskyella sp.]|uniref:glycosyltransferase n=1 Tax=uncultured Winogradskyella sp. TaxID=395353 RepID=UPI002615CE3B|nr:glycosyltransferase [uncultured Winogradskyella sp.]